MIFLTWIPGQAGNDREESRSMTRGGERSMTEKERLEDSKGESGLEKVKAGI